MPDCHAKDCKSRRHITRKSKTQLRWEYSHGRQITFHRIPKKSQVRKEWLDKMNLNDSNVAENAFICSLHFEESDMDKTSLNCIRIRSGAVPFNNINMRNDESSVKRQKILDEHNYNLIKELQNLDPVKIQEIHHNAEKEYNDSSNKNYIDIPGTSGIKELENRNLIQIQEICDNAEKYDSGTCRIEEPKNLDSMEIQEINDNVEQVSQTSTPRISRVKNQGMIVSPYLSENTPRKQSLRTALMCMRKEFQKKIKMLQQKQRRTMKCVAKLKNILKSLKKKNLSAEQLDVLKDL